jgi:hypothetical protein
VRMTLDMDAGELSFVLFAPDQGISREIPGKITGISGPVVAVCCLQSRADTVTISACNGGGVATTDKLQLQAVFDNTCAPKNKVAPIVDSRAKFSAVSSEASPPRNTYAQCKSTPTESGNGPLGPLSGMGSPQSNNNSECGGGSNGSVSNRRRMFGFERQEWSSR